MMHVLPWRRGRFVRLIGLTLVGMLLLMGLGSMAWAEPQACADVGNLTICGDQRKDFASPAGFKIFGNVRIGPKGGAAVVAVGDSGAVFDGSILDPNITTASFFHFNAPESNTGTTDFLIGEVRFLNDPTGLPMFGTAAVPDPASTDGGVTVGRLFVDTINRRIFLPAAGAVPVFTQRGVARNANYRLAFMSQAGALSFYKGGGNVAELGLVNGEFDLNTKTFKATAPIDLKLTDSAENPNLRLTMRFQWTETRQFTGTVDGFKVRLAGLLMDASGLVVKPAVGATPAEFEAATVRVLKTDNPDTPGLDPTDANLIFAFTKLKYANGEWSIGGVETPVRDWEFGSAFKMINQTLGIIKEQGVQAIQIKSTMQFGAGAGASKLPIILKIGRAQVNGQFKPVFQAGLQSIAPKLGIMTFKLEGVVFVGDAAQNFYGIQATTAALQWPAYLGGQTAAGVQGFKLGIDKDKKLKFQLGGGTVTLPPLENKVFRAVLQATVSVQQETAVLTGVGTFTVKLPGNTNTAAVQGSAIMRYSKDTVPAAVSAAGHDLDETCINALREVVACPGVKALSAPADVNAGPKPFEMLLNGFSMKLAGFGLTVTNPKGLDDGGFSADAVGMTLPVGLNAQGTGTGITVNGLVVKGDGVVSVQGGGFELPSLAVGSVQLVGLKGNFVKKASGEYEFTAGGKMPLPGIEPGTGGPGISAQVSIRTTATGNFNGMGVQVSFTAAPGTGIPIGSTGMELTGIGGTFNLNNSTVQVGVTLKASSLARIPAPVNLPVASVNAGMTLQFNPFLMSTNADVSLLIFKVAQASIKLGDQQGFSGGKGMFVNGQFNGLIVHGGMALRVGKVTVSGQQKTRVALSASYTVGLEKGQFGVGKPPFDIFVAGVQFSGGKFRDSRVSPSREVAGVLGTAVIGPLRPSLFVNFGAANGFGNNGFIDIANADKFQWIDSAAVRAAAASGKPGFTSHMLAAPDGQAFSASMLQEDVAIVVTTTTTLVAGINYLEGAPILSLRLPDGSVLSESANTATQLFRRSSDPETGTDAVFVVDQAAPGTYTLMITYAPAEYQHYSYQLNQPPAAAFSQAVCDGADVVGVTVLCDGANGGGSVHLAWTASDLDSPDARVSVGYAPVPEPGAAIDLAVFTPLAETGPLGPGSLVWSLAEVPTGRYQPVVMVEDGSNPALFTASPVIIEVTDQRPPAPPAGLTTVSQAGELLVKWTQNSELDLAGYEIGFGLTNDPAQFVYTRNMGAKEVIAGTNSIVDAKIWGLEDNVEIFYGLRAYDQSGNTSNWVMQQSRPWALSPNTWTPTPGGNGSDVVEIAFAAPLQPATLANALVVKDASGNIVPGESYQLVLLDGSQVIGVGFRPNELLEGAFTATLKGGPGGVMALDGRTMGADYTWAFAMTTYRVYLPVTERE